MVRAKYSTVAVTSHAEDKEHIHVLYNLI